MANERLTEGIVRSHFQNDPLFSVVKFEEQKSTNKRIVNLLANASKSGSGIGRPEFIISFPSGNSNNLIIIECKADPSKHVSTKKNMPNDYAADGALHYAVKLAAEYNVIAVAVSGETKDDLMVSNYYIKKDGTKSKLVNDGKLLNINNYLKIFDNVAFSENLKHVNIISKASYLNELFQAYSITEMTRCTLISAILVSLINEAFRVSYASHATTIDLADAIISAIRAQFNKSCIRNKEEMIAEYEKILNEPLIRQAAIKHRDRSEREQTIEVLKELITYLHKYVYPLVNMEDSGYDVLGRFYTEFIRYAGSEQAQGLVLTPYHITDLFCDLARLTKNSVVYDPCCGTAGFLNTAMKRMIELSDHDTAKIAEIKERQLVGVELRPSMFTYACTNMMMRGDGKSNIYRDDCFQAKAEIIKKHAPTVSFLNPPYDVGTAGQMKFIEHALNVVSHKDGVVVAIVQMSACVKNEKELKVVKQRILSKHRLVAVISMPDDLFYPVGVVTSVMVFEANRQHEGYETWFGMLKDDGFEKVKHKGRVDVFGKWDSIKKKLVEAYLNRKEIDGLSVSKNVCYNDEWCAEAYLHTDYGKLTRDMFIEKIKKHINYKISNGISCGTAAIGATIDKNCVKLDIDGWCYFRYDEIFKIHKGFYNKKPIENINGDIVFIGASDSNNGITSKHSEEEIINTTKTGNEDNAIDGKIFQGKCITVSNNGSVGCAFYQESFFTCSHDVNPLYLKDKELNAYTAIFLCTIIEMEKFRWAYGRKWRPARMPASTIKLPVTKNGSVDFVFMEKFIKSLPYSANL